jgi:hypothetical protein
MYRAIAGLVALGLFSFATAPVNADGCCSSPCGGYTVQWVQKTVVCQEAQWSTHDETRQVCRLVPRWVEQEHHCTVCVPSYSTVTRTVQCYHTEMQMQDREVVCCHRVPVCCVDPCTGCVHTSCQMVAETRHIQVCVPVCVPETREIQCQVCTMTQQDRTYTTRCCVYDRVTEDVTVKVCTCNYVNVERQVCVPVCVPCAPAPCAPCATSCCYSGCSTCCDECCGHHRHRLFGGR